MYVVGVEEKTLEMRLERWSSRAKVLHFALHSRGDFERV